MIPSGRMAEARDAPTCVVVVVFVYSQVMTNNQLKKREHKRETGSSRIALNQEM